MTIDHITDNPLTAWDEAEALASRNDPVQRLRSWVELFRDVYKASEILSQTAFVPSAMQNKPADVAATIMKGFELGIDPLDALANFYVIHGRVGTYAEFMRRRIIQSGHKFKVIESTDQRCIVEGIRKGETEPHRATFTADRARKAGIDLSKYPEDKLLARATSRLCKQAFADVLSGTLLVEDLQDAGDDQPATPTSGSRAVLQRKRQPRKPKAAATQPPETPPAAADEDIDELLGDETQTQPPETPPTATHNDDDDTAALLDTDTETIDGETSSDGDEDNKICDQCNSPIVWGHSPGCIYTQADTEQPELITAAQQTLLMIRLKENGYNTREARHDYVAAVVGHPVASAKELTKSEASSVIDTLES